MTNKLKRELNNLNFTYVTKEEIINVKKLILLSLKLLYNQEVYGYIEPHSLKIYKGLAWSSYSEAIFGAVNITDLEARAKKDILAIEKLLPTHEQIEESKMDFCNFISNFK